MKIPSMIPFASPVYFFYLVIALTPIVILLLWKQKRCLGYESLVTLTFIYISFGGANMKQGLALVAYVSWQTLLVVLYFRYRQKQNQAKIFYLAVVLAILPLALSKLAIFFDFISFSFWGFLGISYLTFRCVQVLMEMRDGLIKKFQLTYYLQFLLFFPSISSGPIDRYRRFLAEIKKPPAREDYLELLDKGLRRIFLGFLYKFILGYYLGTMLLPLVSKVALAQGGFSWELLGYMYVYSFYLFFDFAGYSLFAIATSNLMGYDAPINFNRPFLSWNIKEFWNRWHISLSFWFRDYVYMRLMFTLMKHKVFKSRIVSSNVGYFSLFLLMGVWHGLTWYYIAYGLYHAFLICVTDAWLRFKKRHKIFPSNRFTHLVSIFFTFQAVCVGFLIFSGFLDQLLFIRR